MAQMEKTYSPASNTMLKFQGPYPDPETMETPPPPNDAPKKVSTFSGFFGGAKFGVAHFCFLL